MWSDYVREITRGSAQKAETQAEIGELVGVHQSTIGRWLRDDEPHPTDAAQIAKFAQAFDRNPLEAFVAAGILSEEEAGAGLKADSRKLLDDLRVPKQDGHD